MKVVECVKRFLKQEGLIWKGEAISFSGKSIKKLTEEDFDKLTERDYIIDFGKDGQVALTMEIDLINFKIIGVNLDCTLNCYCGDKKENEKLCEERDLSKEWIKYQLMSRGLVYATMFKQRCNEEREKVKEESNKQRKQIQKKIEFLEKKMTYVDFDEKQGLKNISNLEKIVKDAEVKSL